MHVHLVSVTATCTYTYSILLVCVYFLHPIVHNKGVLGFMMALAFALEHQGQVWSSAAAIDLAMMENRNHVVVSGYI